MDQAVLFFVAITLALLVSLWGSTRKIGFGLTFLLSMLNIFVGIIAVLCSKRIDKEDTK